MAQKKTTVEVSLDGSEAGAGSDGKVLEALNRATKKFVEELRNAGLEPVEGGGYDRGGCGHDRS